MHSGLAPRFRTELGEAACSWMRTALPTRAVFGCSCRRGGWRAGCDDSGELVPIPERVGAPPTSGRHDEHAVDIQLIWSMKWPAPQGHTTPSVVARCGAAGLR